MVSFSPQTLLILKKLGDFLQEGVKQAAVISATGMTPTPEMIASWLEEQMGSWEPMIKGRKIADPETRKAAARFLAGVACNLVTPQEAEDEQVA